MEFEETMYVDQGQNLSVPCLLDDKNSTADGAVMWIREEREAGQNKRLQVQPDGTLSIIDVNRNDSGIYICSLDTLGSNNHTYKVQVQVRSELQLIINL